MIGRIIRAAMYVSDRIMIRTKPMSSMNQAHWGIELSDEIFAKSLARSRIAGEVLWNLLPPEMGALTIRRSFDPYDSNMSKADIRDWLWDHVIFDNKGNIVGLHDMGEVLSCKEGWQAEADWFSRRVRVTNG